MKSTVEKLSPTRVKLSIEVTFDELSPHVDGAYKTLSEKINIPGFRKGKVPTAMIDQRVGRGAVLDEAINAALPTFYSQAAKENDVLVIGRPEVEITELKDKENFSFTVEVDVRPEISLPNFSEIKIKKKKEMKGKKEKERKRNFFFKCNVHIFSTNLLSKLLLLRVVLL